MIPGLRLNEGGQSATGALIDRMVFGHAASDEVVRLAQDRDISPYESLNHRLEQLAGGGPVDELTSGLHVNPNFHGNRSPRADPTLLGAISGLTLHQGVDELALLYLATIQAVAYGTRHIVEQLNSFGYSITHIPMCGGGTKNPIFVKQHANATGCTLLFAREPEAVLLGSSMLGAVAAGIYPDLPTAMRYMTTIARSAHPDESVAGYHDRKYQVFHAMHDDQLKYRDTMDHTNTEPTHLEPSSV